MSESSASLIDAARLRGNVEDLAARLADDPSDGLVRPKVSTRLLRDVSAEARWTQYGREFVFRCDEAAERAGNGEHPSPLRYFLSGLAFCQQVWYAKGAALVGCSLAGLEIDVQTFMDMRGEHLLPGISPHPQYMLLEARVTSPSDPSLVLRMADEANARCPLYNLVARAVPIYERIYHDGRLLRDTVPAERA